MEPELTEEQIGNILTGLGIFGRTAWALEGGKAVAKAASRKLAKWYEEFCPDHWRHNNLQIERRNCITCREKLYQALGMGAADGV